MKVGDRIIVVESLYDMFNHEKGVIVDKIDEDTVAVILDKDKGGACERTLFNTSCLKLDNFNKTPIERKRVGLQAVVDRMSIDDRIDTLEDVLSKYNLSVKDGCGFMYIYDFLEQLSSNWEEFSKEDKDDIVFCLTSERGSKKESKNVKIR